ncbi:MAG: hypothetical protein JWR84_2324 [Caulobacter sp.]|nr:hypothetical protein [Caulobacter sp.]
MRRLAPIALAALLPACAAGAATPPAAIVEEARAAIYGRVTGGSSEEEIKEIPAWMFETPKPMFRKIDINGDKLADWWVDYEKSPNPSYFCGTGGCQNVMYVGQADGTARKVFQHGGGAFVFSGPKTARKLEINFHGSACGSFGASECLRAWRWDAASGAFVETANSKGQTLLPYGSIPALYPEVKDAPAAIRAEVAAREAACKAAGAVQPGDGVIIGNLPDVNGDGVRDWLVGSPYTDCSYEADTPEGDPGGRLAFFVSDGRGFAKAFEQKDAAWNLDIGSSPARISVITPSDDCGLGGKPCPTRALTWDGASKTLK